MHVSSPQIYPYFGLSLTHTLDFLGIKGNVDRKHSKQCLDCVCMHITYMPSLFWCTALTFPNIRIELNPGSAMALVSGIYWQRWGGKRMVTIGVLFDSLSRTTHNGSELKGNVSNPFLWQTKKHKGQRGGVICLRSHSNGKNGDRRPGLLPASPHHWTASWREWDSAGNRLSLEGRWANESGRFIEKDSGHMSGEYYKVFRSSVKSWKW